MRHLILLAALFAWVAGTTVVAQNVGIGTSSPLEKLHIDSGHLKIGRAVLSPGQTNLLKFGDGDFVTIGEDLGDDHLILSAGYFSFRSTGSGGRVGIGTTAFPGAQLEVNGNVKITDGNQAAGKVLTSDADGLAAWRQPVQANTGFKAIITAGSQNIASGPDATIIFTGKDYDDAIAFFSTIYITPASGLYHFDVMVNWDILPVAFATQYNLTLSIGSADVHVAVMQLPLGATGIHTQLISCDLKLTAGQQLSVKAGHNSGILQSVRGSAGAGRYSYFSGHRLY